jgi:O-antigen/teichoic acid export membrane protein
LDGIGTSGREPDDGFVEEPPVVAGNPPPLARALSRDVAIYTLGTIAANAVLYLSVPIYTRVFAPAEYSKFAFVTTVMGLLAGVLVLGGDTALARFWFQEKNERGRSSLSLTWIGFLTIWALVICLLLSPLAPAVASYTLESSGDGTLFILALATLPIAQTSRLLTQIMRNQFRPVPFVVTGVALGCLSLGCGLVFAIWLDMGIAGILLGLLTAETVVLLVRTALTRNMLRGPVDTSLLRPLLRYGVPLVPVTLSYWVFTSADRLIVGKLSGLTDLGYYSVAVTVTMVFVLLSQAVSQAWLPRAIQLFEEDRDRAAVAVGASLTYYIFGLGLLATVISSLSPEVTAVLAGPDYAPAAAAIPLLSLGAVASGSQTIVASGMTLMHKTGRLAAISMLAAVVNVTATLALVPLFGIVGAAAASMAGYVFLSAAYLWASQRLWAIDIEVRRLLVVIGLLIAVVVITTQQRDAPLVVRAGLPLAYVVLSLALAGLHDNERAALRRLRDVLPSRRARG